MANLSNPPEASQIIQDHAHLYASNTNVSNFVSVKLSGYGNYHRWRTQMLCLMKVHEMCWLIDDSTKDFKKKITEKYGCLLKGWIFGSVSDDVLGIVVDLGSAKCVWTTLESCFGSPKSSQQDSSPTKADTTIEMKDKNVVFADTENNENFEVREQKTDGITEREITDNNMDTSESQAKLKEGTLTEKIDSARHKWEIKLLSEAIAQGDLSELSSYLVNTEDKDMIKKKFNSDGNTILHVAVGINRNDFARAILRNINDDLIDIKNNDGSTALHIAAIVGNTSAAEILINRDKKLLHISDNNDKTPLVKACENMHFTTAVYLLNAAERKKTNEEVNDKDKEATDDANTKSKTKSSLPPLPDVDFKIGVNILVQAISAKQYDFAYNLIKQRPEYVVSNDNVLMAMARTFPHSLDFGETLIYPSLDNVSGIMGKRAIRFFKLPVYASSVMIESVSLILRRENGFQDTVLEVVGLIIGVPIVIVYWMYTLIILLLLMVYFPFSVFYSLLWKTVALVVPPIKNIQQRKKDHEKAKMVLELICETVTTEKLPAGNIYTGPILEAACQDAYEVVDQILGTWPEAIRCKDKNGYDIIQLATIHRSEKIYNLIYIIGERKSVYRTIEDSSNNNMLHLVGRLAPSNKLKLRTGAALQLQRELQWRQEVKKLVFPTYVTKENIIMETPDMVFTKEHENLVKEGEKWMKTVAESCSITAALITTIVFAAAITVPGGNDQGTGAPVFLNKVVFNVFAISDAISLFSSATALLVFLSILTARFAEEDFLVRLPRRLIIGLCTLLLSTTAMMVAFSATLFLVFSHDKLWVLAPICGLAFLPIAIFFILQFPLILDLFRSTYISKFGKSTFTAVNLIRMT